MYNASSVKNEVIGLIGWRQNIDSSGIQLTNMITSSSGLYYNDIHPLLTIDNLISIAPDFYQLYEDESQRNNEFTAWLKEKTEAGIIKAIDSWIEKKVKVKTAKNLIKRAILFNTQGANTQTIPQTNVVGLEIKPRFTRSVKVSIKKIGLHFDTAEVVTIKLFKSGKETPEQTLSASVTEGKTLKWFIADWELQGNHTYYLVYDSAAITGKAINDVVDYNFERNGLTVFPYDSKLAVTGISTNQGIDSLFDTSKLAYTISSNYGLNLDIVAQCDYTDFIIEQQDLFKTVIARQVAVDLIREMAYNPNSRLNRNQANIARNEVLYEIDGDTQGRKGGLGQKLEDAIEAITFDSTGIDKDCLPCRKRAVKYRTI